MNSKTIVVVAPPVQELFDRLIAICDEPHYREQFYPRLLRAAGQEITGEGIVMALMLAARDYSRPLPPPVGMFLNRQLHMFLPAFTDNAQALSAARARLEAIGLPSHPVT